MRKAEREKFETFTSEKADDAGLEALTLCLGVPQEPTLEESNVLNETVAIGDKVEGILDDNLDYEERKERLDALMKANLQHIMPTNGGKKSLSPIDLITHDLTTEPAIDRYLENMGVVLGTPGGMKYAKRVFDEAVTYFNTDIAGGKGKDRIPTISNILGKIKKPEDIYRIFKTAAGTDESAKQPSSIRQACALLRIAIVIDYINRDPQFKSMKSCEEYLNQVVDCRFKNIPGSSKTLYPIGPNQHVPLTSRPGIRAKERVSMIRKLILKPEATSYDIGDKVGVRFVTQTRAQAFQLLFNVFFNKDTAMAPFHSIRVKESKTLMPGLDKFILALSQDEQAAKELFEQIAYRVSAKDIGENDNPNSDSSYQALHIVADLPFMNDNGEPDQCSVEFQFVFAEANSINNGTHQPYKTIQTKQVQERVFGNNLVTAFEDQ